MIKINEIESYKDYGKVLAISNGSIEAYVTVDVGPRIIRFGYVGGQNFMQDNRNEVGFRDGEEFESFFGKGKKWENLGGHRIWTSPEAFPDTYYPDTTPVKYELLKNGAVFTPDVERETGLAKELQVTMSDSSDEINVTMRVKNISECDKEFAIWGLTVSSKGGTLIVPMNTNDTGLLANRNISVWPYTDMSDDRIYWGKKYVTLRHNSNAVNPIKLGFDLNDAKLYYVLGNEVFTKSYETLHPTAKYPDNNCSFETYTCDVFTEVESLGELKTVKPNETSVLTENWKLSKKPCDVDFKNGTSLDNFVNKI